MFLIYGSFVFFLNILNLLKCCLCTVASFAFARKYACVVYICIWRGEESLLINTLINFKTIFYMIYFLCITLFHFYISLLHHNKQRSFDFFRDIPSKWCSFCSTFTPFFLLSNKRQPLFETLQQL